MINAWSLLYEELNGTMDETYPIKEDKMTSKNEDDVITFGSDGIGAADTISIDNSATRVAVGTMDGIVRLYDFSGIDFYEQH